MFIPELGVGLCRMVLFSLWKYQAVDISSTPPWKRRFWKFVGFYFFTGTVCPVQFRPKFHADVLSMYIVRKRKLVPEGKLWLKN
jgi:hypothetical protein